MKEREIFDAALAITDPGERHAFLEKACDGDSGLLEHIRKLLDMQQMLGSFLEAPESPPIIAIELPPLAERPGTVIGPYKLLEQIGEGGMGIVYMAEQMSPVRRKVALKIIKPGMDTKQVIARFEAERQALAMMDHPNIAKVLDAGATESGRPYFVMELVRGIPITEYCDQHRLPIPDRLNLFMQVCQAVQHAHQKGIIHRDIKPTNVLVTSLDGLPLPRIIDFGIAKATGQSLTDKTLFTGFAQLIGTPLYMSPEQAELSAVDIDTRGDIYSLGVLLYELLTGTTPFDQDTFRTAALDEVRRIVREVEPPKPSTRLVALGATLTTVSDNRQTDARKLNRSLRGELDWIVMKALEKDRRRRYETASGLARDVERYLAGDPVEAGPPSGWYRLRKFGRRNRVVLTTTVLVALALIAGTTVSIWQAILARRARTDATSQRDRAKTAEADALVQRDEARQAVDDMYTDVAAQWLEQQAALEPVQQKFLQKALDYYQRFAGDESTDPNVQLKTAVAYRRVGDIQEKLGHFSKAKAACHRAIRILERLLAEAPTVRKYQSELAMGEAALTRLLWETGPRAEAEPLLRRVIALQEKLAAAAPSEPQHRSELARSYNTLARFMRLTDTPEGARALRRAIALFEQLASDEPSVLEYRRSLAVAHSNLGLFLYDMGRHTEAESAYRLAIALCEKLVADSPFVPQHRSQLAQSLDQLGQLLVGTNRWSEAEPMFRRGLGLREKLAADSPSVREYQVRLAMGLNNLGGFLGDTGRPKEAEPLLRRTIVLCEKLVAESPSAPDCQRFLAAAHENLGLLLQLTGRSVEAEEEYRQFISLAEKLAGDAPSVPEHRRRLATSNYRLADLLQTAGRPMEVKQGYRRAIALLQELTDATSQNELAWRLATIPDLRFRDPQRALLLAKKAVEEMPHVGDHWNTLGIAHYRTGDWKAAIEALEKSIQLRAGGITAGCFFLAMAHFQMGQKDQARHWYDRAVDTMEKNNSQDHELRRFRAEAAALLGLTEHPTPTTDKKEENSKRSSMP